MESSSSKITTTTTTTTTTTDVDDFDLNDAPKEEDPFEDEAMQDDDDDNKDDPIIKRYEVFLSHQLKDNLFLFQYPLRPHNRPYDFNALKDVSWKPNNKKMEMNFQLNTMSEHYDQDNNHVLNSFALSSQLAPLKANYAIGVLRGNQLHLTPLQNILQFRPNIQQLVERNPMLNTEQTISTVQNNAQTEESDEEDDNDEEMVDDGIQKPKRKTKKTKETQEQNQPTLLTAQVRTKAQERAMLRSYEYMKKQEMAEQPHYLSTHFKDQPATRNIFEKLFESKSNPIPFDMTTKDYLDTLVPYKPDPLAMLKRSQISLENIKRAPAEQQVMACLISANILHFSRIRELCSNIKRDKDALPDEKREPLLVYLDQIAVLVRGRWIIKSHLNSVTNRNIFLQACRDYLLYSFHTKEGVSRREFCSKTNLPSATALMMFEQIAVKDDKSVPKGKRLWRLKLPVDEEFKTYFPMMVEKQEREWQIRAPTIQNNVANQFANVMVEANRMLPRGNMAGANASASASQANAALISGVTVASQTDIEKLLQQFFMEQFKDYGVCNMTLLRQHFTVKQNEVSALRQSPTMIQSLFKRILDDIAQPFMGSQETFVLKKAQDEKHEKYRKVILDLIEASPKTARFRKQQILDLIKEKLGEDIPNSAFSAIMPEFCVSIGTVWKPKSGTVDGK